MKILLVSPYSGVVGGISMWTKNMMSHMETISDVDVELCDFSRRISGQLIKNPIKKAFFAFRDYYRLTQMAKAQVKNYGGDAVHICSSASFLLIKDIAILKEAKQRGLKSFIHFHFGRIPVLAEKRNWEWKLLCKAITLANRAIVMDRLSYNTLLKNGFDNVDLLPNPIGNDINGIIESETVQREPHQLLFAGHCIPTKGVFELVEACSKISNIKLRMIGAVNPEMKRLLLEKAEKKNEWLEIAGQVSHEQTLREMKACDIFILPTYTEGFPNVLLESMACGCPIIASAVGAIPEMLEDENGKHFGVLIEPKNVEALKTAILRMLSDTQFKEECGINAQKRVFERYNINNVANQLINIWKKE